MDGETPESDQNQGLKGLVAAWTPGAGPKGQPLPRGEPQHRARSSTWNPRTLGLRDRHMHFTQNIHADTLPGTVSPSLSTLGTRLVRKWNFFSTQPFLRRVVRITG